MKKKEGEKKKDRSRKSMSREKRAGSRGALVGPVPCRDCTFSPLSSQSATWDFLLLNQQATRSTRDDSVTRPRPRMIETPCLFAMAVRSYAQFLRHHGCRKCGVQMLQSPSSRPLLRPLFAWHPRIAYTLLLSMRRRVNLIIFVRMWENYPRSRQPVRSTLLPQMFCGRRTKIGQTLLF